jgi:hypothetical protein
MMCLLRCLKYNKKLCTVRCYYEHVELYVLSIIKIVKCENKVVNILIFLYMFRVFEQHQKEQINMIRSHCYNCLGTYLQFVFVSLYTLILFGFNCIKGF